MISKAQNRTWYKRIDIEESKSLQTECPRCGEPFYFDPIFEHDTKKCSLCSAQLAEWNLIRYLYLIDVDYAPEIVQHIVGYIRSKGANYGYNELWELLNFLGIHFDV